MAGLLISIVGALISLTGWLLFIAGWLIGVPVGLCVTVLGEPGGLLVAGGAVVLGWLLRRVGQAIVDSVNPGGGEADEPAGRQDAVVGDARAQGESGRPPPESAERRDE